jgi:hypothetical protein
MKIDKRDLLAEIDEEILCADGFDDAIIGYIERASGPVVAVYDTETCIRILEDQGMTKDEAVEYFYFNVVGSYMGDHTPVFMTFFEE